MKLKNEKYATPDNNSVEADIVKGGKKAPFAVAEAYKLIRTNILFLLAQKNGKVIAISSSGANEGKSTTAVNVAIAFSQLGGKVLLVDGDLRRSSIHRKLKIENEDGLSNVLVSFSELTTAVQHLNENLDVLTAGPMPPNPSELLGSTQFETFINDMDENDQLNYDSNIRIENDFTVEYLKSLGFEWSEIDFEYMRKYVEYFKNIGYME